MKVIVNPWIKQFIEKSPTISRGSACGWLIGFQTSVDQTIILSAIAASRYSDTESNFRLPDTVELDELNNIIPNGLKIVGMYHFKPGSSLKVTSPSGIPEKYYKLYQDKLICVTNTETTKFYQMRDTDYSELETFYHELPENLLKPLIVFVNIDFATEINLKLSYLSQISDDILNSIDATLPISKAFLRNSASISDLNSITNPYFTRNTIHSLLEPESELKVYESITNLLETSYSSLSAPQSYVSINLSINKISNLDKIKDLEKFSKFMGAYGKFVVPFVILLNIQKPQSHNEIIDTLNLQLRKELKYKIERSMIKYSHNRKGILILPPESLLMQYKDLILNLKIHLKKVDIVKKQFEIELVENLLFLSYFSQNHLPNIGHSFFAEEDKLIMYRQKFSSLARISDKQLGIGLLRGLAYIYKERGQINSVTEVQRLVSGL
jgi:hypothetical protein